MKKYSLEIKWGLIFSLAIILWVVLEKLLGFYEEKIDQHVVISNLFVIVAITIYVLALLAKRKANNGVMTWKEGFISGLIIAVVVAAISPLSQYVIQTYISPEYFPNAIAYAVESGKATQEAAETYFSLKSYIIQSVVGALVMGAVTAALVALVLRKK